MRRLHIAVALAFAWAGCTPSEPASDAGPGEPASDAGQGVRAPECVRDQDCGEGGHCWEEPPELGQENTCTVCPASLPFYDPNYNSCIECTKHSHCPIEKPACAYGTPIGGFCMECGPFGDEQCIRFDKLCTPNPESLQTACADLCKPCGTDSECPAHTFCMPLPLGNETAYFCAPSYGVAWDDENCSAPWVEAGMGASIDGAMVETCTLVATTCAAIYDQAARKPCAGPDDDDACGVPGLDDGRCRRARCWTRCTSDAECGDLSCNASGYCE